MIDLRQLDAYRDHEWQVRIMGGAHPYPAAEVGAFRIPSPVDGQDLRCMVSSGRSKKGTGLPLWDHVSASRADRTPWWEEMDFLARTFFRPNEVAMQLHVPATEHVNHHPNCLHLWRPTGLKKIPLPPSIMVGPDSSKGRTNKT